MKPSREVLKERFVGFLIWQSILSLVAFVLFTFLRSSFYSPPHCSYHSVLSLFLALVAFIISNLLLSVALHVVSSPLPGSAASPSQLFFVLFRSVFFVSSDSLDPPSLRHSFKVTASIIIFVATSSLSGLIAVVALTGCGLWTVAIRGFVSGTIYSLVYVYKQRWVLQFPILQRPLFFSFKLGISQALIKAFKLNNASYIISALALTLLQEKGSSEYVIYWIVEQIVQFTGVFTVLFCWEMSHHLHQAVHTRRLIFAPPKGSAAAETNPSEALLSALEDSPPGSLVGCLAYLDLCMVCENNVYNWRRDAFFEETSETYKRIIAACLKPLQHLSSNLVDVLEGQHGEKCDLSVQMLASTEIFPPLNPQSFYNIQLCAWGARAAASLTACSHREDRFGVAQLSGSNAAVMSTLLSTLLAVETLMGKKMSSQPSNQFMGPAGIKWATPNTVEKVTATPKLKNSSVHAKAYTIADVLRASIYCIVCSFHEEMVASSKAGLIEKDWIISGKLLYGSREAMVQKLLLFLDFRAT